MNRTAFSIVAFLIAALTTSPGALCQDRPVALPETAASTFGIDQDVFRQVDTLVHQAIDDKKLPGAVVTIGYRGSIIWQRAFGHRQVQPVQIPMTTDTVFDLASLTKPIATATSVMLLAERGVIELSDPVAKHLPEFASHGKEQVTVEQLMLHTGGLIPDNAMSDYTGTVDESIDKFLTLKLNYPPGTRFRYSDVGFQVLAELVRRKVGQDIHQFSRAEVFGPLGMNETTFIPTVDDESGAGAETIPSLAEYRERAAVTQQREGRWMRGEVHDPRAYALGGIAGHAGLFSTAADLSIYAQMMVNRGTFHGVTLLSVDSFNRMTQAYPVPGGQRGLGWDKQSGYSSNRGKSMTDAAFGHGGFTGTALWIDPELQLFVIFLSNRVHPDGKGSVNVLAGQIGTIAADAVIHREQPKSPEQAVTDAKVLCGIDVLKRDGFHQLDQASVGLITNQTGVDLAGNTTALLLHQAENVKLAALLSPEHGIAGILDQSTIEHGVDPATGVVVWSLYGSTRKPTPEMLEDIDTLVFDIQDIGTRFYTYIATMGEAMGVAEEHGLRFVVLDRPNPINGVDVAGPMLDDGAQSFVGYHSLPLRHGMTVGELARMFQSERFPKLDLKVIRCEGWQRQDYYDATGLYWINPSPNMRNLTQAILYPGVGMLEYTNLSVGRGTDTPFELLGAPWINAGRLAADLNALDLPGITFTPERFTPSSSKYTGESCEGIRLMIVDRSVIQPVNVGLAIAVTLRENYQDAWSVKPLARLLSSEEVYDAILDRKSIDHVIELAQRDVPGFQQRRASYLLYTSESIVQERSSVPAD